jgi:hypothetical protein
MSGLKENPVLGQGGLARLRTARGRRIVASSGTARKLTDNAARCAMRLSVRLHYAVCARAIWNGCCFVASFASDYASIAARFEPDQLSTKNHITTPEYHIRYEKMKIALEENRSFTKLSVAKCRGRLENKTYPFK